MKVPVPFSVNDPLVGKLKLLIKIEFPEGSISFSKTLKLTA